MRIPVARVQGRPPEMALQAGFLSQGNTTRRGWELGDRLN